MKKNKKQSLSPQINAQMTLEEYKYAVINSLRTQFGLSKQEEVRVLRTNNELWEQYHKDFTPEVCAQGINSGLI